MGLGVSLAIEWPFSIQKRICRHKRRRKATIFGWFLFTVAENCYALLKCVHDFSLSRFSGLVTTVNDDSVVRPPDGIWANIPGEASGLLELWTWVFVEEHHRSLKDWDVTTLQLRYLDFTCWWNWQLYIRMPNRSVDGPGIFSEGQKGQHSHQVRW